MSAPKLFWITSLCLCSFSAHGLLISQTFSSSITGSVIPSLPDGTEVATSLTYDDALLPADSGQFSVANIGGSFSIRIGELIVTETDDSLYPSFPQVVFLEGNAVAFDYFSRPVDAFGLMNLFVATIPTGGVADNNVYIFDSSNNLLASSTEIVSVSEPGTLVLLGMGLMALLGVRKDRSRNGV